jgi:hypothetical protein
MYQTSSSRRGRNRPNDAKEPCLVGQSGLRQRVSGVPSGGEGEARRPLSMPSHTATNSTKAADVQIIFRRAPQPSYAPGHIPFGW